MIELVIGSAVGAVVGHIGLKTTIWHESGGSFAKLAKPKRKAIDDGFYEKESLFFPKTQSKYLEVKKLPKTGSIVQVQARAGHGVSISEKALEGGYVNAKWNDKLTTALTKVINGELKFEIIRDGKAARIGQLYVYIGTDYNYGRPFETYADNYIYPSKMIKHILKNIHKKHLLESKPFDKQDDSFSESFIDNVQTAYFTDSQKMQAIDGLGLDPSHEAYDFSSPKTYKDPRLEWEEVRGNFCPKWSKSLNTLLDAVEDGVMEFKSDKAGLSAKIGNTKIDISDIGFEYGCPFGNDTYPDTETYFRLKRIHSEYDNRYYEIAKEVAEARDSYIEKSMEKLEKLREEDDEVLNRLWMNTEEILPRQSLQESEE